MSLLEGLAMLGVFVGTQAIITTLLINLFNEKINNLRTEMSNNMKTINDNFYVIRNCLERKFKDEEIGVLKP